MMTMSFLADPGFEGVPLDGMPNMVSLTLAILPLGLVVFKFSVGLALLAIVQLALVLFSAVYTYRRARWRGRGKVQSALFAVVVYAGCCFLTNMLGAVIVTEGWVK